MFETNAKIVEPKKPKTTVHGADEPQFGEQLTKSISQLLNNHPEVLKSKHFWMFPHLQNFKTLFSEEAAEERSRKYSSSSQGRRTADATCTTCCLLWFAMTVLFAALFGWARTSQSDTPNEFQWTCTDFPYEYIPYKVEKCNTEMVLSGGTLESDVGTNKFQFDLYGLVVKSQNIGGVKLSSSKTVYRGANLASGPDCLYSLHTQGNVDLVITLYSGTKGFWPELQITQKSMLANLGIDMVQIENYMVDDDQISFQDLHAKLDQILSLVRAHTGGNVYIHCYTGEHDTGVAFAAILKCMTDVSYASMIDNLKCHMGYDEHRREYLAQTYSRAKALIDSYTCK